MIGPSLEEISDELGEKVTIAKLNIDDNPDAPGRYGVRGIPTMILFKGGAPAATKVGAEPKGRIKALLENELAYAIRTSCRRWLAALLCRETPALAPRKTGLSGRSVSVRVDRGGGR